MMRPILTDSVILADYGGLGLVFALLAIFFLVFPFVIAIPIVFFVSWRSRKPPPLPSFGKSTDGKE